MLSGVSERLEQHQDHFGQRRGCFIARRKCWPFHNDDKLLVMDVKRQRVVCMMMTVLKSQFSMLRFGSIMYFGKKIPTSQFSTTSVRSPFCIRSMIHFESASNQYTYEPAINNRSSLYTWQLQLRLKETCSAASCFVSSYNLSCKTKQRVGPRSYPYA